MLNFFLISAIFFTAGTVKGMVGMAFPLVSIALLTLAYGTKVAIALYLIPSLFSNLYQAFSKGIGITLVCEHYGLVFCSLILIAPGVWLLGYFPSDKLVLCLGVVLISYAVYSLMKKTFSQESLPLARNKLGCVIGLGNGLIMGMTGSCIMPLSIYLGSVNLTRDRMVKLLGILFLLMTLMLMLWLWIFGHFKLDIAQWSLWALVPTILGQYAGGLFRRRITKEVFVLYFVWTLFAIGIYMIISAVA